MVMKRLIYQFFAEPTQTALYSFGQLIFISYFVVLMLEVPVKFADLEVSLKEI